MHRNPLLDPIEAPPPDPVEDPLLDTPEDPLNPREPLREPEKKPNPEDARR